MNDRTNKHQEKKRYPNITKSPVENNKALAVTPNIVPLMALLVLELFVVARTCPDTGGSARGARVGMIVRTATGSNTGVVVSGGNVVAAIGNPVGNATGANGATVATATGNGVGGGKGAAVVTKTGNGVGGGSGAVVVTSTGNGVGGGNGAGVVARTGNGVGGTKVPTGALTGLRTGVVASPLLSIPAILGQVFMPIRLHYTICPPH